MMVGMMRGIGTIFELRILKSEMISDLCCLFLTP